MSSHLWASGFRPLFLTAAVGAALLIPLWAWMWGLGGGLPSTWPPTIWHAHEMLFGVVGAAVGGFLLTAVPSWTGRRGFAGIPLILLVCLWGLGRLSIATSGYWPGALVAALDVGFLPALGVLIAPALVRARNRNTPLLLVLAALTACNVAVHWEIAQRDPGAAYRAILVGIDIMLVLVTVIGGRIIPAFTANALRASGVAERLRVWPAVNIAAIAMMILVAALDLAWPDRAATGIAAGVAAIIQALRMLQWRSFATLRQPIVWILHLAYLWLPIGLALKCLALLEGSAAGAFWVHALTVGTLSTMVLGVMSRAALGHTGRPLVVHPMVCATYLLLLLATCLRVWGLGVLGLPYPQVILGSAVLWTTAFALFLWVYVPVLCGARVDGKPG